MIACESGRLFSQQTCTSYRCYCSAGVKLTFLPFDGEEGTVADTRLNPGKRDQLELRSHGSAASVYRFYCPADVKLTFLPFVVKALSLTLAKYPGLNTSLEPGGAAVLQHHSHNIGVAMATSNGLVVPNVKQVSLLLRRCCCV